MNSPLHIDSPLPEQPEDSEFLLQLPEDFDYKKATSVANQTLSEKIRRGLPVIGAEVIVAIKNALNITSAATVSNPKIRNTEMKQTTVITNAILEAQAMTGYPSPEFIIFKLQERRSRLKELLASKSEVKPE